MTGTTTGTTAGTTTGTTGAGSGSSRWSGEVVVGVDGSECSRAALRWAAEWADRSGVELVAVASWQYPRTAVLPGGPRLISPDEMDLAAREALHTSVVGELAAGAERARLEVARGPASWALLDRLERGGAGLVVVGKRGLGPLEGRLLGSVSRRVAELAPCPVAIVPRGDVPDGPIVVGVDGSPAAERAIDWAVEAAQHTGASVVVVHGLAGLPAELAPSALDRFVAQAHELVDRLAARVTDAGVPAETYVDVADPRGLLLAVADKRRGRMIVLGESGDGPVSGVLIGSVVNHVAQQADRPVVIVPAR